MIAYGTLNGMDIKNLFDFTVQCIIIYKLIAGNYKNGAKRKVALNFLHSPFKRI